MKGANLIKRQRVWSERAKVSHALVGLRGLLSLKVQCNSPRSCGGEWESVTFERCVAAQKEAAVRQPVISPGYLQHTEKEMTINYHWMGLWALFRDGERGRTELTQWRCITLLLNRRFVGQLRMSKRWWVDFLSIIFWARSSPPISFSHLNRSVCLLKLAYRLTIVNLF